MGHNYTMEEAAEWLRIGRRTLQDVIRLHPHYFAAGRRKLFSETHLLRLYTVLLERGQPPIQAIEDLKAAREARAKKHYDSYLKPDGFIYFVETGGFVKIGFSRTRRSRYYHIRVASPHDVQLLMTMPGTLEDEAALHKRFAALHHRGEWFRYEGKLVEYIGKLQAMAEAASR